MGGHEKHFDSRLVLSFDDMYSRLVKFIDEYKKLPRADSHFIEEKKIGIWCSARRNDKKHDRLDISKIKKLEKLNLCIGIKMIYLTENTKI